jgi:DHA2 family multidrug resistance protein
MSDAAAAVEPSVMDKLRPKSIWFKIGFVGSLTCLVLLDGVNGGMTSSLGRYLMGSCAATSDQITWATIVYYVGKLYALLLAARLQERIGQRRALLGAATILVVSTSAGVLITNYPSLLAVISIQAGAGGMVIALGQGALLMAFPRGAQPIVQPFFALASVMFPANMTQWYLGAFAYNLHWQHAYLWIVPLGLLGSGWLFWNQDVLSTATRRVPVPVLKIILMVTSLFAIVYTLQQGNRNRWLESPNIVWALLLAAVCLLGVAFTESDGRPTYLPYRAFRYANFTFGFSTAMLAGVAFLGGGSVISGYTAGVLTYTVFDSGLVQLSAAAFTTVALLGAGVALRFTKLPGILVIYIGQLLFSIAMWNLGQAPSNIHFEGLLPWLILRGFALGCQFLPITLMTLMCLPAEDDVAAAGIFNFSRQFGALLGIAWLQTLREHLVDRNQTIFGNALSAINPNAINYAQVLQHALSAYGIDPSQTAPTATALMLQESSRQWLNISFNGCFQALSALFLFSFPLVILARILTQRFLRPTSC